MPMAVNRPVCRDCGIGGSHRFRPWRPGVWRFLLPQSGRVLAGVTDRSCDLEGLRACLRHACDNSPRRGRQVHVAFGGGLVLAEQIHGASLAAIDLLQPPLDPLPGCDGLATRMPGLALVIRTADCLPVVLWDPIQQVVGLIHAGWRGLVSHLPLRVLSLVHRLYHSHPQDLWVGIGPAIRACCYEVGKEFEQCFGRFVRGRHGRLTCDLVGCATQQLLAGGVRPSHLIDSGQCTACSPREIGGAAISRGEPPLWHSVRRDGERGGRLLSFVMIRP